MDTVTQQEILFMEKVADLINSTNYYKCSNEDTDWGGRLFYLSTKDLKFFMSVKEKDINEISEDEYAWYIWTKAYCLSVTKNYQSIHITTFDQSF